MVGSFLPPSLCLAWLRLALAWLRQSLVVFRRSRSLARMEVGVSELLLLGSLVSLLLRLRRIHGCFALRGDLRLLADAGFNFYVLCKKIKIPKRPVVFLGSFGFGFLFLFLFWGSPTPR